MIALILAIAGCVCALAGALGIAGVVALPGWPLLLAGLLLVAVAAVLSGRVSL